MGEATRAAVITALLAMLGSATSYLWVSVQELRQHQAASRQYILLLDMVKEAIDDYEVRIRHLEVSTAVMKQKAIHHDSSK